MDRLLAGKPLTLDMRKNFNAGHFAQAVQPIFFIPVMLLVIGTIDF